MTDEKNSQLVKKVAEMGENLVPKRLFSERNRSNSGRYCTSDLKVDLGEEREG